MATDTIGDLTFRQSFNTLEQGQENPYIKELLTTAMAGAIRSSFPPLARFCQVYHIPTPIPAFNRAVTAGRNMRDYAVQSLKRYRHLVETDPDIYETKPTLFTKLFEAEDEHTLTFDEIRDNAQTFIIAGSDTTANKFTYLLWLVCRNPAIRDRLIREVQALPDEFEDHDTWALPYLNHTVEETLRLYSGAPSALPRIVPPEGATLPGYYFKGGITVASQAYSLDRDPHIYPKPEEFDPSRCEDPSKEMKDAFIAFGAGSRICVGLHLANMELRLATCTFFRAYPNAKVSTL